MRILSLYLARNILIGSLTVLIILVAVNIVFSFLSELTFLTGNYTAVSAFIFVLLETPNRMVQMFPLAVMMGMVFSLGRLADQSEITVIRAAGVSIGKINEVIILSIIIPLALMMVINETIVPHSEQAARNFKNMAKGRDNFYHLKNGVWLKNGDSYYFIPRLTSPRTMKNVNIFVYDQNRVLTEARTAKSARLDQKGNMTLKDIESTIFGKNRIKIKKEDTLKASGFYPEVVQNFKIEPHTLSTADLLIQKKYLTQNKLESREINNALFKKITYPLSAVLMALLAFPFVLKSSRTGGAGKRIFAGIMAGLGFYLTTLIFERIGLVYGIPALINNFAPLLLFGALTVFLYRKV